MYRIYELCEACLIIPGGLSRLVYLDEDTSWIHRAWTLQEAVAPKSCFCLFSWAWGDCTLQATFPVTIRDVEPRQAAMAQMQGLLEMSDRSPRVIWPDENSTSPRESGCVKINLLGNEDRDAILKNALIGAIDMKGKEGMASAIWRSAVMRTACHPVDMVFSIMGILGVTLEPSKFSSGDRFPAAVALMQELLRNGGRAEWLGTAPEVGPSPELTTLPVIPQARAAGRAVLDANYRKVDSWWWLRGSPLGAVDDEGYFLFTAPAVSVKRNGAQQAPVAFDSHTGERWAVVASPTSPGRERFHRIRGTPSS